MCQKGCGGSGVQTKLLDVKKCTTIIELRKKNADYVVCIYNHIRRHSSLEMLTPTEYETAYAPTLQLT